MTRITLGQAVRIRMQRTGEAEYEAIDRLLRWRRHAPDHSSWCRLNMPRLVQMANLSPECDCDGTEPPDDA